MHFFPSFTPYMRMCAQTCLSMLWSQASVVFLNSLFMFSCGGVWRNDAADRVAGPHSHSACKRLFFLLPVYRIKFNESFAEMNRSTNEWKTIVGTAMFFIGFTALVLMWEKRFGE